MQTQWYLCQIEKYPDREGDELRITDNLSAAHPDIFIGGINALLEFTSAGSNKRNQGGWYVWLPVIPRVGDTIQFAGWQVQVSKVVLEANWESRTGMMEGQVVSARISIRGDIVPKLTDASFSIESLNNDSVNKWENFARRGHDLQYYAWALKHESYVIESDEMGEIFYYRWHTRIRPVAGDIIFVKDKRWRVTEVELASANASTDGWLTLEAISYDE